VRREILGTVYLLLPLLGGALVHGVCMRTGWLRGLARPIDGGRTFRGRPLFGESKTFRGPILVAAGGAAVWALQRNVLHGVEALAAIELVDYAALPGAWFGALACGVAELAELPNSFLKRQLGIKPGGTAAGLRGALFYVLDQVDLLFGYWLVLAVAGAATPARVALSAAVVGCVHPLLTVAGYLLRMRPTPR
jgi:hypothetical protein